jgi:hypothetical protein
MLDRRNVQTKRPMNKLDHKKFGPFKVKKAAVGKGCVLALFCFVFFLSGVKCTVELVPYPPRGGIHVMNEKNKKIRNIMGLGFSRDPLRRDIDNSVSHMTTWRYSEILTS